MTERTPSSRRMLAALAAASTLLVLPACDANEAESGGESAEVSNETLASMVADADGFSVAAGSLTDAGLATVFDGAAAYTVFLPQDAAFEKLGAAGEELRTAEQRPAMVAILRDHIVPGYLTPEDIAKAIELDNDKSVQMTTMGGHTLTFTAQGDVIQVASADGASARFDGDALRASNGVAIPLDGVLKKVDPAAT